MSERKRKRYDIKKIHEFIDSASFATKDKHYAESRKKSATQHKKRTGEPTRTKKKPVSSHGVPSKSRKLEPRVVVHEKGRVQKKEEEIVFQLVESPETEKKQEVITLTRVAPAAEDLFSEEALYEIEKTIDKGKILHKQARKGPKRSSTQKDVIPMASVRGTGENVPEWEPMEEPSQGKETRMDGSGQKKTGSVPEFERVDEDQASSFSHDEATMPSLEPVEVEIARERRPSENQSETTALEEKRAKKAREKQAIRELRLQEREAQRLKREQERKAHEEERVVEKRLQEEERLKEEEKKKAAAEVREQQREEHRLLKEREKNLRIEQRNVKKKEKEERKQRMVELKRAPAPTSPVVSEASPPETLERGEIPFFKPEQAPESSVPLHHEETREPVMPPEPPAKDILSTKEKRREQKRLQREEKEKHLQPVQEEVPFEEAREPAMPPEPPAEDILSPRQKRQEQKRLRKEEKEKQRLERIAWKEKEKQERQQRKQIEIQPERPELETIDKGEQKRKETQEKQARREAKKQERENQKQHKVQLKKERRTIATQDFAMRRKEKEQQQQKEEEWTEERQGIADLPMRESTEPRADLALQKMVEQQQQKEAEQQAVENTKEDRKLKAVEHKMRKEQEKKEKEARKVKMREEENAKKKMELHFEEQIIKEKQADAEERITIFDGFDTIDQETAQLLYNHGYTSVEKLLAATIDDLKKIGIKKKLAKSILDESQEFVEWKVMDAEEKPDEKLGGIL